MAEHAREGAVAARVRVAAAERGELAVGRDHGPRVAHDAAHVLFIDHVPHAARAALELDLDGELRGEVEVGLAAALARDVREGLPFPRAVERHDGELDAGEVAAAALLDDGALDALDDARASLRVVEPCAERVAAAGERP